MTIKPSNINKEIFRAYDIRGIAYTQLTEQTMLHIGLALGSQAITQNCNTIVLAQDGRLSSPDLWAYLVKGLLATGINIIDIGRVPTPVLYFATYYYKTNCGAMLTGSHNPGEYNGLKMIIDGRSISGEEVERLYQRILDQDYINGTGSYQENFIIDYYIQEVTNKILLNQKLNKKLKIIIDNGNGISGVVAAKLYRALGCEVISLFEEVDGNFPNHHPDPGNPDNLKTLIQTVLDTKADLGLAFDGDADRLGVVTDQGQVIMPDRQMMLFSKAILESNPNATIVFDVKCTSHLPEYILKHNGIPCMSKTGHSHIKNKMIETKALLAGEMSGHIFFKERWYGFDDALYAGARLLEILANNLANNLENNLAETFHDTCEALPDSFNTPEINIAITEEKKFIFIDQLSKHHNFKDYKKIITIDGLRVEFEDGWGLIRASNTTPCLVLRFEAVSELALDRIKKEFNNNIRAIDDAVYF